MILRCLRPHWSRSMDWHRRSSASAMSSCARLRVTRLRHRFYLRKRNCNFSTWLMHLAESRKNLLCRADGRLNVGCGVRCTHEGGFELRGRKINFLLEHGAMEAGEFLGV